MLSRFIIISLFLVQSLFGQQFFQGLSQHNPLGGLVELNQPNINLRTGLRAYYKLEECDSPSFTPRVDSTGNGFTLNVQNGAQCTTQNSVSGLIGVAYYNANALDGVQIQSEIEPTSYNGASAGNSGVGSGSDFTISCWIYISGAAAGSAMISQWGGATLDNWALFVNTIGATATVNFRIKGQQSPSQTADVQQLNVTLNAWHHYVVGFNHSRFTSGAPFMYFDNTFQETDASPTDQHGCQHGGSSWFTIGNYSGLTAGSAVIRVDEVGYWLRVLTSAEVSTLFNSGSGSRPPGI